MDYCCGNNVMIIPTLEDVCCRFQRRGSSDMDVVREVKGVIYNVMFDPSSGVSEVMF